MKGFRLQTVIAVGLVAAAFWACSKSSTNGGGDTPGVPENLTAQATSDGMGIILSWAAGAGPVDPENYIIYFNDAPLDTVPATQTSYTVSDAGIGTYAVSALAGGNESAKAELSTLPIETSNLDVYELNSSGPSGVTINDQFSAGAISVCDANAPTLMDFYLTDDAPGTDMSLLYFKGASLITQDGGASGVGCLPSGQWKTAYIAKVSGSFTGVADPGSSMETQVFSGAGEFVFKVQISGEWHYGYFTTQAPDAANHKVTISSLKVQKIPGFKKIQ